MFCVLKINKRKQTVFEKIFGGLLKDEYNVSTIPVFKGAPFYLLEICIGKRGVDWEKVLLFVGKCASRLLVNCNLEIPDEMNIGMFKSKLLYDTMMENTFLNILKNNTDKHNLKTVSVLDEKAEHTDFVENLSSFSLTLSITTGEKEKYQNICNKIMERTGLCPTVLGEFADGEVKINTESNVMTVKHNGEFINISSGEDFSVPPIYENLLPEGVSKYSFYSALYELCGVFSLGECIFDTILVNNEKKNVQDIHFS